EEFEGRVPAVPANDVVVPGDDERFEEPLLVDLRGEVDDVRAVAVVKIVVFRAGVKRLEQLAHHRQRGDVHGFGGGPFTRQFRCRRGFSREGVRVVHWRLSAGAMLTGPPSFGTPATRVTGPASCAFLGSITWKEIDLLCLPLPPLWLRWWGA